MAGVCLSVRALTRTTPGSSITSECWGDSVGPAREEWGRAEWHRLNTAALRSHTTTSPWGLSTLHPSSPCTPALHAHAKSPTAEAGESTMAQPRGHCVLDGATALAIKVKWDLRGLACIQQGGAPPAVAQLLVQVAGWANWIPLVFSGPRHWRALGGERVESLG